MHVVSYSAGVAVAATLLWAGVVKLRTRGVFRERLADYQVMPYAATLPASYLVPSAEVLAAILLVVPATRVIGAGAAFTLLTTFTAVLVRISRQGRAVVCGCFGGNEELDVIGLPTIVRSAFLAILAGLALAPVGPISPHSFLLVPALIIVVPMAAELSRLAVDLVDELRYRERVVVEGREEVAN